MLDPDGGMYLLLILVLQKSEVTPPVERPLDDTPQEVLRLLLRVGGLQAHSIEPPHTDGALVAVGERLEGDEDVLVETVEHLLLQLLYEDRVRPGPCREPPVLTPHSPLGLYLVPAVPHAGDEETDQQEDGGETAQDNSRRMLHSAHYSHGSRGVVLGTNRRNTLDIFPEVEVPCKVVHVKQMQREALAEGWPVHKYLMLPGQDLPIHYR